MQEATFAHVWKVNGEILAIVYRYYQQKEPIFDMGSIGKLWENAKSTTPVGLEPTTSE